MKYRLCDVTNSANTGADAIKRAPIINVNTGLRCLRIGDISQKRNYSEWGFTKTTEDDYKQYKLEKNDIIIARTGNTIGVNCFIEKDMESVYNNGLIRIKADTDKIIPKFMYYIIRSTDCQNYIQSIAFGTSTQPNMKIQEFLNYEFEYYNKDIQSKIVSIIDSIDKKIELNNSINNNLEQQAQAIFKSWFIDFEPFGGTMPNDWRFVQLDEVADFEGGYSYKGNELQPSKYAMATIKNFERKGGFKLDGYKEIIPSDKCKIEQEAHLYDILVAHTDLTQNADVIGNAELLLCTNKYEKIIFSMDVVKVIPKNHMPHFILATMLKSKNFKSHCLGYVNGTTVLHLSKKALPDYIIYIPKDLSLLSKLEEFLKNIYILISNNLNENIRLTQLRDTLLPKLMSGEIDVANVKIDEKFDGSSTDKLSFSEK